MEAFNFNTQLVHYDFSQLQPRKLNSFFFSVAQKWLLIMLLVTCITKKLQANALFIFWMQTLNTVSKTTADFESSKTSVLPFSMLFLQTRDAEVCLT